MAQMTCKQRLIHAFKCEPTDRMPVRIWGLDPFHRNPDPTWEPLYELVERFEMDVFRDWHPTAEEADPPLYQTEWERRESDKPDMWEGVSTIHTPDGPLTQVSYMPKSGYPGYVKKNYIETVQDARRWLSLPERRTQCGVQSYWELDRRTGDRALLVVGLAEAMYGIQAMMGSEVFGFWLMDERELLREMVDKAYRGIEDQVRHYLSHGIGDCYGWVGPELCIPPLASPRDFREFVFDYDKRIIDMIHDAGKLVWIHCHGDMNPVLEEFVEMGLDCLNPIEPPPVGSLTLAEAKARVAGRMCFDGGVEDGDFDLREPSEIVKITERIVEQGKPGGGFILCPTSAPTTWPRQSERHIANYRAFVETGIRLGRYE